MYKNVIGLHKIKFKTTNRKIDSTNQSVDSKSDKDLPMVPLTSSTNEYYLENENEAVDNNEYEEFYFTNEPSNVVFDNETDELENEYEFDERDENLNGAKVSRAVRLDLINEIKDEFLDDDSENKSSSNNLLDEEEEEDDEDENNVDNVDNVNLSHLRICVDDIEEFADKSNKTCFVFVIQVWNIQPRLLSDNEEKREAPNWVVKRKYDEFYVLDTKLKEFHACLSSNEDPNRLATHLPSKQRALFFISNAKNLEYLNSIKNNFAKYLQVSLK